MNVLFVFCSEKLSIEFNSFLEKLVFFSNFIVKIDHAKTDQLGTKLIARRRRAAAVGLKAPSFKHTF